MVLLASQTIAVIGNDSTIELKALVIMLRIALHLWGILSIEQTVLHPPVFSWRIHQNLWRHFVPTAADSEGLFEGTGTSNRLAMCKYEI